MKWKSHSQNIWMILKKNNIPLFVLCFLPFFLFLYPIEYKFKGPPQVIERSFLISAIIAAFPALLCISFISFFRQQTSSYWLKPLVEIIVLAARVDGTITQKDKAVFIRSFKSELGSRKLKKALKYFEEVKNDNSLNLEESCIKLLRVFERSNTRVLLSVIVKIALSDQYLSAKEEVFLNRVCKHLGLSQNTLEAILARRAYISENDKKRERTQSFKPRFSSINRYYKILGLTESSTFDEVKKAYRSLAKQYHPDKIRDYDLKENAKKQFQEITEAYDKIKDRIG